MSVPPRRRLPERPSLEQLRKQAKEHLDTLRAADPSATLATAQHALAREYGFDSWPTLVHHVESLQPHRRMRPGEDWSTREINWLRISPLHAAARDGDLKKPKQLLEAGADLTARDEHIRSTPLAWAAKFGQLKMVKFLLKRGAPNTSPEDPPWATPRAWAMRRGHKKIAELL